MNEITAFIADWNSLRVPDNSVSCEMKYLVRIFRRNNDLYKKICWLGEKNREVANGAGLSRIDIEMAAGMLGENSATVPGSAKDLLVSAYLRQADEVRESLFEILRNGEPRAKKNAAEVFMRVNEPAAVPEICRIIGEFDASHRREVAGWMEKMSGNPSPMDMPLIKNTLRESAVGLGKNGQDAMLEFRRYFTRIRNAHENAKKEAEDRKKIVGPRGQANEARLRKAAC